MGPQLRLAALEKGWRSDRCEHQPVSVPVGEDLAYVTGVDHQVWAIRYNPQTGYITPWVKIANSPATYDSPAAAWDHENGNLIRVFVRTTNNHLAEIMTTFPSNGISWSDLGDR